MQHVRNCVKAKHKFFLCLYKAIQTSEKQKIVTNYQAR